MYAFFKNKILNDLTENAVEFSIPYSLIGFGVKLPNN